MQIKRIGALFVIVVLASIIGLRLYLLYWGFWYDRFLVPPGDDVANHISLIKAILTTGSYLEISSYPPGYHGLMAVFSKIFSADPFKLVTYSGPILVILPVIATFVLTKRWFNPPAALIAAALVGLTGAGPIFAYGDGNYPNLVGGGFFMILGFAYAILALREKPLRNSAIATAWLIALALTHHLSFAIFILISLVYAVILIIAHLVFDRSLLKLETIKRFILPGIVAAMIVGVLIYGKTLILPLVQGLLTGNQPAYLTAYFSTPISLGQYGEIVGGLPWLVGILGLITLVFVRSSVPWERRWFIITWIVTLFIASRLSAVGVPGRFVRELTVPLAISGGYFGVWLIGQARTKVYRLIAAGIIAILIVTNTVMLLVGPFTLPEGFSRLVWFWPEDQEKLAVLQGLPSQSRIVATPSSPYYEVLIKDRFITVSGDVGNNEYLFIGTKPRGNPDGKVYPYFADFDKIKATLLEFQLAKTIKTFPDGSQIKKVVVP